MKQIEMWRTLGSPRRGSQRTVGEAGGITEIASLIVFCRSAKAPETGRPPVAKHPALQSLAWQFRNRLPGRGPQTIFGP